MSTNLSRGWWRDDRAGATPQGRDARLARQSSEHRSGTALGFPALSTATT